MIGPGIQDENGELDLPPGAFGGPLNLEHAFDHFINVSRYRGTLLLLYAILVAVTAGLIRWAFLLPNDSFRQELCVVLASGIEIFLAAPIVIKLAAKARPVAFSSAFLLSLACCTLAFFSESPLRALLIEAAVGLVLVFILEIFFDQLLESARDFYERAETQRERDLENRESEFQEKVDEWEERHEIVGHGFGALDQYEDPGQDPSDQEK